VEIKWKGMKTLSVLRRTAMKRNFTREVELEAHKNGIIKE
jgi:hypothetical protein